MRKIRSLNDLRAARKELALRREVTKQEFSRQVGVIRSDAGAYLLRKVLLPVGIGLGLAFALRYFFGSRSNDDNAAETSTGQAARSQHGQPQMKHSDNRWLSYVSILLSLFKIYQNTVGQQQRPATTPQQAQQTTEGNGGTVTPGDLVRQYREKSASKEPLNKTDN